MTRRPQKSPEPGPLLCHPLPQSRCVQPLLTVVVFGLDLSPGEDVKPPTLHMRGPGQQEPPASAILTVMSAVE